MKKCAGQLCIHIMPLKNRTKNLNGTIFPFFLFKTFFYSVYNILVFNMIEINGAHGEGGGALLRVSAALSAVKLKPFHMTNIRAGRPKPGLMPQHLHALKLLQEMSRASCTDIQIGSQEFYFKPESLKGGNYTVDVATAGSTTLILQAAMIPASFADAPITLTLRGGTDVKWAPTADYLKHVTLPILRSLGCRADVLIKRRGHYPRGGGMIEAEINPIKKLKPITLLESEFSNINGVSHSVNLPEHVAVRQAESAKQILKSAGYSADIKIQNSNEELGPGSAIVLWTDGKTPLGGSSIGEPRKRAELVGKLAAEELLSHISSGAALDRYMGDQIIPYMAIAGNSHIKTAQLTQHTLTNIYSAEKFTGKSFKVIGSLGQPSEIVVD
ncbi:RNA 3'-terminal phosphate cyclase [anaerobic digester metagenome]